MQGEAVDAGDVQITAVDAADEILLAAIISLGDRNRKTLGFLPHAVFRQAAKTGTLLAAVEGGLLAGYALYGLPGDRVRLAHLCVDDSYRGQGVNGKLIDAVSERHADRLGIMLKCRKNYGLEKMWTRLGFQMRTEVAGRGDAREPLVVWWRSHGHPDLFTDVESPALVTAAMDCNVFADLHSSLDRNGALETKALTANWLVDLIELVVLPQLVTEIHNGRHAAERKVQIHALMRYKQPALAQIDQDQMLRQLIEAAWEDLGVELPRTANDHADLAYVVQAHAAGVQLLVTRDEGLIALSPVAEKVCGVRILGPTDSVLAIDELTRTQAYQPGRLLGTALSTTAVAAGQEQQQLVFLNKPGGEKQSAFKKRLRDFAAQPGQWLRQQITDQDGRLLATYCYESRGGELHVPLLRVDEQHPLGATLARQLLFLLRQCCRDLGVEIIRLSDPHPQRAVLAAAEEDAFRPAGDSSLVALVLDRITETRALDAHVASLAKQLGLTLPPLTTPLPAAAASAVEHAWWPVKITDAQLPTFLVPVQPRWSYELFGYPEGLLARDHNLGLSREHVYYRAPLPRGETAPARILWYASSDDTMGVSAVFACSRLEQCVTDDGERLYRQFKHLGVYRRKDVLEKSAKYAGRAMALRFSDTAMFPSTVPLRRLVQLGTRYGQKVNVQSVFKISPDLFRALYEEGHRLR
ncbi:GNAT family N-acetyltransferase [Streptomyces sp. NBC_00687]|uniref:GNAT family N-acetyltransferase n=1 Tax=Streptomyces sp. NBC_00687 TaxID=2975807 RepID=UPI0022564A40|nr:GNAT family N-acetyltransferase [Streptomyces sp. NBC_00687]MCX4920101.1 GNAT family N-acetyltransferase [Streptomyces sp. NBC_00687]